MNDERKRQQEPLSFDEMTLQGDINIHRRDLTPPKRRKLKEKDRNGSPAWVPALLIVLLLASLGYSAFLYMEREKLANSYASLVEERENVRRNLSSTANTLEEANERLAGLEAELEKKTQESERAAQRGRQLNNALQQSEQREKTLQTQLQGVNKEKNDLSQQLGQMRSERDQALQSGEKMAADHASQSAEYQTQITQLETDLKQKTEDWQRERSALSANQSRLENELNQTKARFQEESNASLSIIREKGALETENASLKQELTQMRGDLAKARARAAAAEEVNTGDLVAYSEEIKAAEVTYREPLSDIRIPRRLGAVALQVLITETGAVEKVFIVPGQALEAEVAAGLVQNMYQWKFTPPVYRQTRVKTWQTVLVGQE